MAFAEIVTVVPVTDTTVEFVGIPVLLNGWGSFRDRSCWENLVENTIERVFCFSCSVIGCHESCDKF